MKIWRSYGSEHSMNLVMIGRFKDAGSAAKAKHIIDELTRQVRADENAGLLHVGQPQTRYTGAMLDLLGRLNCNLIAPSEVEQLAYDFDVEHVGNEIVMTTEESEFSAILKILLDKGAKVEVYSAHDYPGTGHGRGG